MENVLVKLNDRHFMVVGKIQSSMIILLNLSAAFYTDLEVLVTHQQELNMVYRVTLSCFLLIPLKTDPRTMTGIFSFSLSAHLCSPSLLIPATSHSKYLKPQVEIGRHHGLQCHQLSEKT